MDKIITEKVLAYLKKTWTEKSQCPMCGSNSWSVSDKIFELREYHGGDFIIGGGGPIVPIIPVTCSNCGNTVIVNAIVVGAVEPKKNIDDKKSSDGKE